MKLGQYKMLDKGIMFRKLFGCWDQLHKVERGYENISDD